MSQYKIARKNFLDATIVAFAQPSDPELESPNIIIEPQESLIHKAVELIKSKDPNFFKGVRKIVSGDQPNYGHVESGPGKDPAIINLNSPRINREVKSKMQGAPQEEIDKEIVRQLAGTIAHERGHIMSFDPQSGFKGGETPAEQAEKELLQKIDR
jgi:hypothetical protein